MSKDLVQKDALGNVIPATVEPSPPEVHQMQKMNLCRDYLESFTMSDELTNHRNEVVPTLAGAARAMGVAPSTIERWAAIYPTSFYPLYEQIRIEAEIRILNLALLKKTDAGISKLVLNRMGYADPEANKGSGGGGEAPAINITFTSPEAKGITIEAEGETLDIEDQP